MNTDLRQKISNFMTNRRRQLRSLEARKFPPYFLGMTAGDYVRRYNALNASSYQPRITLDFTPESLAEPSHGYDPLEPLCTEEAIDSRTLH